MVPFVERQVSNFGLRIDLRLPWYRACAVNLLFVHGVPRYKGSPGGLDRIRPGWPESLVRTVWQKGTTR